MSDIFLCGTLRHVPLLECVLGRPVDVHDLTEAELAGYADYNAVGQSFALLQSSPGKTVSGMLIRDLSQTDFSRLKFYQDGFGNEPRSLAVQTTADNTIQAQVFLPKSEIPGNGALWSLEPWVDRMGAISQRAAVEMMAHFGHLNAQEVGRRHQGIMIRAAAWVAAQKRPGDSDHDLARDVVVHAHHRRYSNFFASEEMDLQYRRYDGQLSPVLNRGAQVLGQAVVILPYDPKLDSVLLVQQFRMPVFLGGDPSPWIWEPVSGLIDPGEGAHEAAHREAMEEAGLNLLKLEPISGVYSSTGANSEFAHLFVGLADFDKRETGGGLAEEGEDIRVEIMPYTDLIQAVDKGRYRDLPLVTTVLWLARHRERLRADA